MRLIILPIALLATACAMPVGENLAGPPPGTCPPGHGGDCRDGPPPQIDANAERNERMQAAQQSAALMAITGAVMSMAANGGHPGYGQPTPAFWPGHPPQPYGQPGYGQPPAPPPPPPPKPACVPMTPSAHCPGM
jgi:hypothetical protein